MLDEPLSDLDIQTNIGVIIRQSLHGCVSNVNFMYIAGYPRAYSFYYHICYSWGMWLSIC